METQASIMAKTRAKAAAGGCIALGAALAAGAALADTTRSPDATATSALAAPLNTTTFVTGVSSAGALDTTPLAFTLILR